MKSRDKENSLDSIERAKYIGTITGFHFEEHVKKWKSENSGTKKNPNENARFEKECKLAYMGLLARHIEEHLRRLMCLEMVFKREEVDEWYQENKCMYQVYKSTKPKKLLMRKRRPEGHPKGFLI
jgi:hypothetical protein